MSLNDGGGWLKPSLISLLFWGLWGFLTKIGAEKVPWQTTMIYFGFCFIIIALLGKPVLAFKAFDGYHLAALSAGIAVALGYVFFFIALTKGSATAVIPVTSLYVALACLLAFVFLAEPVTFKKILGIGCAVLAVYFLST